MPYYQTHKALSPLDPKMISHERVQAVFDAIKSGISRGHAGLSYGIRDDSVPDYKGFYVARSLSFGTLAPGHPNYTCAFIGDEIDVRVSNAKTGGSPWVADELPTPADIAAYWKPVDDDKTRQDMLAKFCEIETHVLNNRLADLGDAEKLAVVKEEDIPFNTLRKFCEIIAKHLPNAQPYIDDHVIAAATDPRGYLVKHDLLKSKTLDGCKHFSWRRNLTGGKSLFSEAGCIHEIDWKAEAGDIVYCVNRNLALFGGSQRIALEDDGENYLAEFWLKRAAQELAPMGYAIGFVDNVGDSYIFTILERDNAPRFVSQGVMLGLETSVQEVPEPKKKGLLGWLRGK